MGREIGVKAFDHVRSFFGEASGCPEDLNGDGSVDAADLGILFAQWACATGCSGDLNGSGLVDAADLGDLIAAWGQECGP